jgi:hypothetical protein
LLVVVGVVLVTLIKAVAVEVRGDTVQELDFLLAQATLM